jgi:hypothetical protein
MSKILVIQPHRMLRQAITLFLFPAHEVQVTEAVPESLPASDFDAVIVDAASLRETTGLDAKTIDMIQNWRVPTVWIESSETTQRPKWETLVIVKTPIDKEALESSLRHCLKDPITAKRNGTPTTRAEGRTHTQKDGGTAVTANLQVIELVDVVEDTAAQTASVTEQDK